MSPNLNLTKLKAEVLYILQKTGRTDFHKLFKILYFADMRHLKERGRPIVTNDYVAMKNGPVPSTLYDIIKDIKYDTFNPFLPNWREVLEVEDYFITSSQEPDIDELSENDIITLDGVIAWALPKSMAELTELSHGLAYSRVFDPSRPNRPINVYDIAEEGGATPEQIRLLKERDTIRKILARPNSLGTLTSNHHVTPCTCQQ
jgi:hypothetical protein